MKVNGIGRVVLAAALVAAGCQSSSTGVSSRGGGGGAGVPAMRETLIYLASDAQEGRGVGTAGIERAGKYIADRFKVLGLRQPAGWGGYYQPFEMTVGATIDPGTTLEAGGRKWVLGTDYTPVNFSPAKAFSGPVVFAGYGVSSKDHKYDDYEGVDVKGKVVLVLRYEPQNERGKSRFTGAEWSGEAALDKKARTAAERGAVAVLFVNPPMVGDTPNTPSGHGAPATAPTTASTGPTTAATAPAGKRVAATEDRLMTFGRQVSGRVTPIPVVQVTREVAGALLDAAGAPELVDLQNEIDGSGRPGSREFRGAVAAGDVKIRHDRREVRNVAAVLPGRGPRKDEYVVVGAHYDHLGKGGLVPGSRAGDAIFRGADDNASGTTAMLEIARRLSERGGLDRSVIFVAFTAEEEGLIGSAHFVKNSPVPLEKISYMLNLDMVGRLRDDTLMVGGGGTAETLKPILTVADEGSRLKFKSIGEGGLGPSDHMTFAQRQIPVLFFFTGLHGDYHRPTDDWTKINFEGLEEVVDVGVRVATDLAEAPRAQYVTAADAKSMSLGSSSARVTLGVIPDYSEDQTTAGVIISGTTPGTPAAAAGMKAGDRIVQIGEKKIENLFDLTEFLAGAEPNQVVRVKLVRGKDPVEVTATLKERKGQ